MNSNKELMIFNVNLRSFCDWGTQTSTWKLLRNSKPRLHDGCARHTSPSQTVLCSQTQKNKSIGTCSSELYTFYLLKLPPPPRAAICNINDQKLHLVISSLYPSNINQTAPRKKTDTSTLNGLWEHWQASSRSWRWIHSFRSRSKNLSEVAVVIRVIQCQIVLQSTSFFLPNECSNAGAAVKSKSWHFVWSWSIAVSWL